MQSSTRSEATQSLTEQAHQSIKRFILTDNPAADVRMTETFFAEQLGISKSPVREALNSLQSEGLVRIEPRRGAFVRQFSAKEVADLYDLREVLEAFAASTANITPDLIDKLRSSVDRTEDLLRSNDKEEYIDEDIHFHRLIVDSVGNEQLSQVHRNLQEKLWLCRCQTYRVTSSDTPVAHRSIADALARHDRDAAQRCTRNHIQFVRAGLMRVFAERERTTDVQP